MIHAPVIHPIALPTSAVRLTWLFERVNVTANMPADFRGLLRTLAPRKLAALADQSQWACYGALINHLGTLFPVDVYVVDWATELYEGGETWWTWGIPLNWEGCDYYYDGVGNTSLAVQLIARFKDGASASMDSKELTVHLDAIGPLLMQPLAPDLKKPPRGRQWRAPWQGLNDLWNWFNQNTGYGWLDVCAYEASETGDEGPPWNLEEIRHCQQLWRECEPILKRIYALMHYIDAEPAKRLPLLAGALVGDASTLKQITKPR